MINESEICQTYDCNSGSDIREYFGCNSFDDLFPDNYYENDRTNESVFIQDQERYRKNHTFLTFFTSDIEQAKSYGIGENSIGNFLTGFLYYLKEWIKRNKSDASKVTDLQRANELKQIFEKSNNVN